MQYKIGDKVKFSNHCYQSYLFQQEEILEGEITEVRDDAIYEVESTDGRVWFLYEEELQ